MKKIFNITFTILLIYFSFYYTGKISNYIKNKDPIMIKIKMAENKYHKAPVDAIINGNTIIPGISGISINLEESYAKMKKVNNYLENMLVFDAIKPNISLSDNLDKLVVAGNSLNNNVSILVKIDNLTILKSLLSNSKDFYNLILSPTFVENNLEYLETIDNNIVVSKEIDIADFCYTTNINEKNLCKSIPTIYTLPITYNYYYNTLETLENGSILTYQIINEKSINELNSITSSIKNFGYKIVSLDTLLQEKQT